ncbi:MAG: septum formation initiator family protein [Rhizobiaceae bacterium]|nr:septum formation initiator family protein [Rhizobiaceae bacterium]
MSTRQKRTNPLGLFVVPVICLVLIVYFLHHTNRGRFGMQASAEMAQKELSLQSELAGFKHQREILAARVALMRVGTMERDMLDQQARFHLNLVHDSEIVIFRN